MKVNRRDFLQSAATGVGVSLFDRTLHFDDNLENTIKEVRTNLLGIYTIVAYLKDERTENVLPARKSASKLCKFTVSDGRLRRAVCRRRRRR